MKDIFLTIDDSTSGETGTLIDALQARKIPALFFCRGDRLAQNSVPAIHAIEQGFVLGNHAWSHKRFSMLTYEEGVAEIEATEKLIDAAYREAGVSRPGKYFRFPHLDRGTGGWVVDYAAAGRHRDALTALFTGGLNIDLAAPAPALVEKKNALQNWLRNNGFAPPAGFSAIRHPWYTQTEMARAADCLLTFSTSDWMITPRHAGRWAYKDLDDLRHKIDEDQALQGDGPDVILAHDQDGLMPTVLALLDHFQDRGYRFAAIG